jgi:ABC-type multidrug transport system ATPase subunit
MLRVTALKKSIGAFSLSIDSLHIQTPGIYGLIGPNGCGKSTFAKMLGGLALPDSGEIKQTFDYRQITMITQKPYIMDDTVYNNLLYPLKLRGIKNSKDICSKFLEKIGFSERGNERAKVLSGGEKQKLALARAMIFNPQFIILDEAMTELDLDSLDFFEALILERQRLKPVVWIIISHQLAHVRKLCGHVFFMANGRLEAEGPMEKLLRSNNPLVMRFLKHEALEVEKT